GLPAMTQLDASSATMEDCFTDAPDLTPYVALANRIPLDERNPDPKSAQLDAETLRFTEMSESTDLSLPDRIDDDAWNRALWFTAKGASVAYPADLAGAHGRGLNALGLRLDSNASDRDDDEDGEDGM